jgi:acyl-CoA synthetase (AMP-forming)/AMP-acid ligase II
MDALGARARMVAGTGVDLGTFPALLARVYGDRPAIAAPSGPPGLPVRPVRSYRDLEDDVARLAAAHEALGHVSRARVIIAVRNRIDVILHIFALVRAGAIPLPVNPRLRPAELAEIVRRSGASVVIADRGDASASASEDGARRCWSEGTGDRDLAGWLAANPGARLGATGRVDPDDTALLLATSGTTGHPKIAALGSAGLLRSARGLVLAPFGRDRGLRAGRDVVVCALPLAHVMGISTFLGALSAGTKILHHERFHARDVLDTIETDRPNLFVGVPTMYADLEAAGAAHYDLSSIQVWISAADVMPPERARRFQRYGAAGMIGHRAVGTATFLDCYGMVELSGAAAFRVFPPSPLRDVEVPPFAVMLPGFEARVVDEEGHPLPWGRPGALQVRGPGVLRGYEGTPSSGPLPGGWFPTGDLARVWPGGFFTFMGRGRDRLKVGGFSVFPAEVESVLREHPDVAEVVVVGIPDERLGERPVALVVPRRGAWGATAPETRELPHVDPVHDGGSAGSADSAGSAPKPPADFDVEAFLGWAAGRVAGYRRPRAALAVTALPRGNHGKVDRAAATRVATELLGGSATAGA